MKLIIFFKLFLFASMSFAIGWEEVPREISEKRGISINSEPNQSGGCHKFRISLPSKLHFSELGERKFWSATYKVVSEKTRGWQLASKGTQVALPSRPDGRSVRIDGLCLSDSDLHSAYISTVYGGSQGISPMIILLNLDAYK
ncbi:hypothetical protein [Microbulbifer sp. GL-2]|uniref:hypothetical protein n=1 Tax=Microbulbifer sp. GL-2 TaxID=2591606 RepID=UPI001163DA4A|nr:hypothetical protein [Microbulbifer sp. GL-2]BBM02522.1 hypothetical protein GL2_25960 [Microbulbifer sp. GL-2]